MINTVLHGGNLPDPIAILEEIVRRSGMSIIQIAFQNSFFLHPDEVRRKTPRYPEYARYSRTHYPGKKKRDYADWKGRRVRLDDNSRAQMAWAWYSGRKIERASGYGVRHVWGHPWDPDAYTAGWNLCYMPFWVGMLTEDQHPHPQLQKAIQQASYDIFFRDDPVCARPAFVRDPGLDLGTLLGNQAVKILKQTLTAGQDIPVGSETTASAEQKVLTIRTRTKNSWSNLLKAVRSLQGKTDVSFGSPNVEASSKSHVRKMLRETGWKLEKLQRFIEARIAPKNAS